MKIQAGGNVNVSATSTLVSDVSSDTESGGLGGASHATATINFTDNTSAVIGAGRTGPCRERGLARHDRELEPHEQRPVPLHRLHWRGGLRLRVQHHQQRAPHSLTGRPGTTRLSRASTASTSGPPTTSTTARTTTIPYASASDRRSRTAAAGLTYNDTASGASGRDRDRRPADHPLRRHACCPELHHE